MFAILYIERKLDKKLLQLYLFPDISPALRTFFVVVM